MINWIEFTDALGTAEMSKEFSQLSLSIGEKLRSQMTQRSITIL